MAWPNARPKRLLSGNQFLNFTLQKQSSEGGLPSTNSVKIGLQHLQEYLDKKRDILEPSVTPKVDYKNYLMLGYYRNPLNHIFFNEGLVVTAL